VIGFLDALGVKWAHLIGHSLGGAVVAAVADSAPSRVASLTLVAPIGLGTALDVDYLRGFASASSRRELKPQLAKLFADPGQVTRRLVDDVLKYKRLDGVDQALSTLLTTMISDEGQGAAQAVDITDMLSRPGVPATVVWGDRDVIAAPPPEGAPGDKLPVRIIEDAGHMVHMERPGDLKELIQRVIS
jgi:pyruvate dehydrogenase E2 component (dihydrolipoamide acetyltransferase)